MLKAGGAASAGILLCWASGKALALEFSSQNSKIVNIKEDTDARIQQTSQVNLNIFFLYFFLKKTLAMCLFNVKSFWYNLKQEIKFVIGHKCPAFLRQDNVGCKFWLQISRLVKPG